MYDDKKYISQYDQPQWGFIDQQVENIYEDLGEHSIEKLNYDFDYLLGKTNPRHN